MRSISKNSWVVMVIGVGFCGMSCSSETGASGAAGGLKCGEGTIAAGGYCVPIDASVEAGENGGGAGAAGSGGTAGAAGSTAGAGGGTGGSKPEDGGDAQEAAVDAAEDAPETAVVCTGTCGDPGCGACPAMPVVNARRPDGDIYGIEYGIDAFETTVAEYQVFLDANVALQTDEACSLNESYEPDPFTFDFPYPDMPIHGVDWCDARAYCEWAGKRICKDFDSYVGDAAKSEWYNACTLGGTQEYPYGDVYDPDACPSEQFPQVPHAPGSVATCEGAYTGLFDMVGNMSEWTAACGDGEYAAYCVIRGVLGGSYGTPGCGRNSAPRMMPHANVGIRCCEDHF